VRQDELEFFIKGNVSLEPAERAKPFAWLPDECWKHMSLLSEQFSEKFGTLLDDFAEHEYKWKRWYDADAPESVKYPKQYKKLSGFHRLMLLRCFRVDRVYRAITDYVSGIMGNRYTAGRPTLVGKALSFTHELFFLSFFLSYQSTTLSSRAVDGHQMYFFGG